MKIKRIKQNGKVKLSKDVSDVSLEEAVAEIQEILEREGKQIKKKVKTSKNTTSPASSAGMRQGIPGKAHKAT